MSTLTLEPRDAGVLEAEDFEVEFDGDLTDSPLHDPQACVTTCVRTVATFAPCYISIK